MRKNKLAVLALLAVLSLNACGKNNDNANTTTPAPTETVTEVPTETPTETPSDEVTGGGEATDGALVSNEAIDTFHAKVKEMVGENYLPSMAYDATRLKEVVGIEPEWYDAALAEGPMMSAHVDELIVIHATEGNLENVQNAMKAYHETILANTLNYPMNVPRIQGSVVETVGDYVLFVMVGNIDEMQYTEEDEMAAAYKEQNLAIVEEAKTILK
ncbi:DUF4358 domain-containing protein [Clostridium sp. Marseille-P299]|uniref:DUF4358 domain-containing protein n=1 Tax=Clostridium sp. Marseille-P299 TaxID=1805477 RepID=UPI000834F79B|nr:DUF4358 domain-containing protein [Clostridium sp. Marseille-P299]